MPCFLLSSVKSQVSAGKQGWDPNPGCLSRPRAKLPACFLRAPSPNLSVLAQLWRVMRDMEQPWLRKGSLLSFPLWFLCFSSSLLQLIGFFPPSQWHSGCIQVSKPWCTTDIKNKSLRRTWWVAFQWAYSGYTELVLSQNFIKKSFRKARRKKEPSCVAGFRHWRAEGLL